MQNGVHAAPGRHVLTWVHVVKATEVNRGGGSLLILSSFAFDLCIPSCISKTRKLRCLPEKRGHPLYEPCESALDLCVNSLSHTSEASVKLVD
jgi:hypothetical protein